MAETTDWVCANGVAFDPRSGTRADDVWDQSMRRRDAEPSALPTELGMAWWTKERPWASLPVSEDETHSASLTVSSWARRRAPEGAEGRRILSNTAGGRGEEAWASAKKWAMVARRVRGNGECVEACDWWSTST